jgi:hypothetical protein
LNLSASTRLEVCPVTVVSNITTLAATVDKDCEDIATKFQFGHRGVSQKQQQQKSSFCVDKDSVIEKDDRRTYWRKHKQSKRQELQMKTEENIRDLKRKQAAREDETFRRKERQSKQAAREDGDFRLKEKAQELKAKRESRKNEIFREKDRKAKQAVRESYEYRQQELAMEVASKRKRRCDGMYREVERVAKRQKRLDERFSESERTQNTSARSKHRQNPAHKHQEKVESRRRTVGASYKDCKEKFHAALLDGPVYVCTSCHQTWFKHSVVQAENVKALGGVFDRCRTHYKSAHDKEWLCRTCQTAIRCDKIPRLSVANKCSFPPKPDELNLHELEERLLSPRIPFMQLRELPRGGQMSIKGNVVNVPVDIAPTITSLPRHLGAAETIPVKLKRKLSYTTAPFTENVRPLRVLAALHWLLRNSPLFRNAGIKIDETWLETITADQQVTEQVLTEFLNTGSNETNPNVHAEDDQDDSDSDHFSEVDETERPSGNMDTMLDDAEYDTNHVLEIAPGEGQKPLSLFQDRDAEYLAFPTIFCGQTRPEDEERPTKVHYSDLCKWELRCIDRRVAQSIPNMFFKLKKVQIQQVSSKVSLAVRRCKTKGRKFTAAQLLDQDTRQTIVNLDEGYRIFRTLRNSPPYLETRKKDLMAMIRQLGCPTWFVSLSAADTQWTDLLRILGKLIDKNNYSDEDLKDNWPMTSRLVSSDPVTCARFFDHRLQLFIKNVLKHELNPIGKIKDSFIRIEFQQRGSPHAHIMFWVEDAPTQAYSSPDEIASFIDQHVSCSADVSEESAKYLKIQKHRHTKTCRKKGKPICRFGFPKPPMNKTMVLEPLLDSEQEDKDNFELIQKVLGHKKHKDGMSISMTEFLHDLHLNEDEYIRAVRTSIKSTTIFLKRDPSEIRVNPYMKHLLDTYRANHDIQFITDPYACAVYIVAYMSKSQKGMSLLLEKACKEAREGNADLRHQVRHIGNKFLNSVEIGAQEAAYLLLQLPVTRSSRSVLFINTSPPEERTFLLKPKEALEQMDPNSTDIESGNLVKRYSVRPKKLERWCLADYASKLQVKYPQQHEEPYDSDHEDDPHSSNDSDEELEDTTEAIDITLRSGVRIKSCKIQKVIRSVGYSSTNDVENYSREKIMLYVPWRKEPADILGTHETYEGHFQVQKEAIEAKMSCYEPNRTLTSEIFEQINLDDEDLPTVAPNAQHIEAQDADVGPTDSTQFAFYRPTKQDHSQYDISADVGLPTSTADTTGLAILPTRIPDDEFREHLSSLNRKQREFFTHVLQWVTTKTEPLYAFLTGGAGVGKSVVVKTLYQALQRCLCSTEGENPEDRRILLCAPTGKAAYNIQGCTMHSGFQIDPNKGYQYHKLSAERLNTLQVKYRHLAVIVIDEISMVGNKQFLYVDQRLQDIKGNKKPFGGVHMIVVGDLYQLQPVFDQWIFKNLTDGLGPLATNLWKTYFIMHELTEIMRQKEDQTFAQLLNRLREGKQTPSDVVQLQSRHLNPLSPDYPFSAIHLFPRCADVQAYNNQIFTACTTEKVKITATDAVVGDMTPQTKRQTLEYVATLTENRTSGLIKHLEVAVDMQYETNANISVEDGITNGSGCLIRKIQYISPHNPVPSIIWVQFDEAKVGQQTRRDYSSYFRQGISKEWTPIFAIKRTFVVTKKHISVIRTQFPLRPAAAKTIHKAQGSTLDTIVVNMQYARAHGHYVALSRVRSMAGLHILELNENKIKVDSAVAEEMGRLKSESLLQLCYTPLYSYPPGLCKISFQNARSLHKHFPDLAGDHNIVASDIILIAESRLITTDTDHEYAIEGFMIHRNDQHQTSHHRPPHGQVLYMADHCQIFTVKTASAPKFECSIIHLTSPRDLQIVTIYKSPTCDNPAFNQHMLTKLLPHIDITAPLVILGDFNFDLFQNQEPFLEFMLNTFHSRQYMNHPTTTSGSLLDLVFANTDLTSHDAVYCAWSDHRTITVVI